MIRTANTSDLKRIIELLHQVNMVHHVIRPDLFKPYTTKYNEQELEGLLSDESKPIFVYDDGVVRGYAFCQISEVKDNQLLQDVKTLYIDDICVDENARGKHVGKALYEYVRDYARSIGCYHITLNVWEGNAAALSFYRNMGMKVQKTTMEAILWQRLFRLTVAGRCQGTCTWHTDGWWKKDDGITVKKQQKIWNIQI